MRPMDTSCHDEGHCKTSVTFKGHGHTQRGSSQALGHLLTETTYSTAAEGSVLLLPVRRTHSSARGRGVQGSVHPLPGPAICGALSAQGHSKNSELEHAPCQLLGAGLRLIFPQGEGGGGREASSPSAPGQRHSQQLSAGPQLFHSTRPSLSISG